MENIYLMVNGTKVELPESVLVQIEGIIKSKIDKETEEQTLINRFYTVWKDQYGSYADKDRISFEIVKDSKYLKISYPNCNSPWSYSIFDACKKFCDENDDYWPCHYDWCSPKYLYIRVGSV